MAEKALLASALSVAIPSTTHHLAGERHALETAKRFLVISITPPRSLTLLILLLTALVWSSLAAFKMPLILFA